MPVTRRRAVAAASAAVLVDEEEEEEERATAAIDISSDSDAGSESGSEVDDEEPTSDEDYIDISDSDGEEGGGAGSEEESESEAEREPEQSGVDRGEASCRKIADLLRDSEGIVESIEEQGQQDCDPVEGNEAEEDPYAYLQEDADDDGAPFKDGDPENIYPRSSFCINCKGDVCRGDAVLFKQKVYEKSGKRRSKCIGKRIVAGRVIKESYGKEKQQHTFTIQVFWSKGAGKLPPLYLLLVKGRNLYRIMTYRQPWLNEADRLKALDEKHSRGDAARHVRALSRPDAAKNSKKLMQKGKHQSQPRRHDNGTSIKKGKKRVMQSSNPDPPTKKSRNEENQASSAKQCAGDRKAKTSRARLDKSDRTTRARMRERKADSQQNLAGGSHAKFGERCAGSGSNMQASHVYHLVGVQQPPFEIMRPQRPPPFREVGNASQPHRDGRSTACPHPRMGFQHPNMALAGWHPPAYYLGNTPNQFSSFASLNAPQTVPHPPLDQFGASFAPFNVPQTVYRHRPEGGYVMPQFRYSGGSNGFPR